MSPEAVRWGVELTPDKPLDEVVSAGAVAEDTGFDAAFVSSHYFNRDPFVSCAQVAAETDEILLGPGVENRYETHPARLASAMATVDEVSNGRGLFGIGAGDRSALSALGIDQHRPLRRVLETMEVARSLWAGETVSHEGVVTDASLTYGPRTIPIFVGAQGPQMLRMSATHADGVLVNASHPRDLAWAADRLTAGRRDRPRERGPFTALAFASVCVADTETAARETARPPVAFIAAGAADPVLDRHDLERADVTAVRDALERSALEEAFSRVTDPMIDAFCIAGTVETVADRFVAALEFVDGIVAGSPLGPTPAVAIEQIASARDRALDIHESS